MQLKVLYYNPVTNEMSKMLSSGKRITGLYALAQHFVIILFTSPGSDTLSPELGGGLKRISSGNYSSNDLVRLYRNVGIAVMRTKEQILEQQIDLNIPLNEKLKDASVLRVEVVKSKLKIWIYIESQSGEKASFSM